MEAWIARPRTVTDADALARAAIVEHGPGVSLATLASASGLSPPALVKRFGFKDEFVFQALLPSTPPRWWAVLAEPPGADAQTVLADVLLELCTSFQEVGPALAALRMSTIDVLGHAELRGARRSVRCLLQRSGLGDGHGTGRHREPGRRLDAAAVGQRDASAASGSGSFTYRSAQRNCSQSMCPIDSRAR